LRPRRERYAAVVVLAALGVFWVAVLLAGAESPGYSQRRDYVSSLAAHGVEDAWLGVLAIAAVGVAGLGAAVLLWRLTRAAALALAWAGVGFVVVALVRIDCPNGAARCGLGGRFDVHGAPAITHWTAAVVSTVLVLAGATFVAYALFRRGRRAAGMASAVAAAATLVALLGTGGESPGVVQRAWIAVMTAWLVGAAAVSLTRR
jgi:hypothetical membrane protein